MDRLFEEVAYIAYHFHWPYEQLMALEHRERQLWAGEIAKINRRFDDEAGQQGGAEWRSGSREDGSGEGSR